MDESFKLCRPVPIATAGNPDAPHRSRGRVLLVAAALAFAMPGGIFAQQLQRPNSDNCRAPATSKQTEGESQTALQGSQDSAANKLSDCGGVLKPPTTGDSAMEKPAPRGGKMPVIPPSAVPGQQEQKTPEAK
ncbi:MULTISPECIES: hypothetical protein [Rhizobium]|uniref:Uncharacterized protein n=1 Tax=Rhizobium paranaense TaxID=1650438 RepID=A0A7W8XS49_9HYPH|nr:hypothetical protein [Rhizobium paranaense]MBB5574568.1 hypothetical protein [Rhizobium paranaense]